jgi:hypothetical protein
METDAREELLAFLDRRAFNPILRSSPDDYPEAARHKLEDVKGRTQQELRRYHQKYRSASEVRRRFLEGVTSRAAAKVNADLRTLRLPRLPDLKDEFLALCDRLGVS